MQPPAVIFRESDHTYWLDQIEIPGLSYVLSSCGFVNHNGIKKSVIETASNRGDVAHFTSRLFDEDNRSNVGSVEEWEECLKDPLDPWTRSRLKAWAKFRTEFKFNPAVIEQPMSHCVNGMAFGMTPDRFGDSCVGLLVVEIKATAEIELSHRIQVAAQQDAFKGSRRFIVQLGDGDFNVVEPTDRNDLRIFGAALACVHYRWKEGMR